MNGNVIKATISADWRQVAVYTTVIVMEGCWLYMLLSVINNAAIDGRISVFGVLAVFPVSVVFNKLLRNIRVHKALLSIVSWLAWFAGMLLLVKFQLFAAAAWSEVAWLMAVPRAIANVIYAFSPELLILLSSAAIWWLGGNLANKGVRFDQTVTRFQFGLIMLLLALYISYAVDVSVEHSVKVVGTLDVRHYHGTAAGLADRPGDLCRPAACDSCRCKMGLGVDNACNTVYHKPYSVTRWRRSPTAGDGTATNRNTGANAIVENTGVSESSPANNMGCCVSGNYRYRVMEDVVHDSALDASQAFKYKRRGDRASEGCI
ncbi:MAG: hypothetical protein P8105_11550 [Dehalococcoidia bacterium]